MAEQSRLIKKYPNRRLYDTRTSTYITLSDVKNLVLGHESFQVVDAKSGEDLTRTVLLQIILEEEAGGAPMFSSDLLSQMIRFYGSAMQGMLGRYLDNNMAAFLEMQSRLKEQAKVIYGDRIGGSQDLWTQFLSFQGPAMQQMMGAYIEQTQKVFQQMQESLKDQTRKIFPDGAVPASDPGQAEPPDPVKRKK